ncbi:MAG: DUF4956 domain-containing protein [Clostridiales bacterium]|nr:DUF4956 domain-containing protein [Clostridiales bacterium]
MEILFKSVIGVNGLTINNFFVCVGVALLMGFIISFSHMFRTKYTQSFIISLAILPAIVAIVILMVNGNIGTGIAVAGAFSLTRFRSQPGTAKEISSIFLAMMIGLTCGTGYVGIAAVSTVILCALIIFYGLVGYGKKNENKKALTVVIPENLNYTEIFNDIFDTYTTECELVKVKTANMGSMFKLRYEIKLKDDKSEKKFIDEIRTRNGNLEVMLCRTEVFEELI